MRRIVAAAAPSASATHATTLLRRGTQRGRVKMGRILRADCRPARSRLSPQHLQSHRRLVLARRAYPTALVRRSGASSHRQHTNLEYGADGHTGNRRNGGKRRSFSRHISTPAGKTHALTPCEYHAWTRCLQDPAEPDFRLESTLGPHAQPARYERAVADMVDSRKLDQSTQRISSTLDRDQTGGSGRSCLGRLTRQALAYSQ
jgi:hypothetical protein